MDYDFGVDFKPIVGTNDYLTKYDYFVDAMEAYASEEEEARQNESSILVNLQSNYINYNLENNINGEVVSGTATGGSITNLIDSSAPFANISGGEEV